MNKEQLEKLSDFEINKSIAAIQGMDYSGVTEEMVHDYNMRDYCNNWSDMGPLIESAGVTIGSYDGDGFAFNNFRGGVDEEIWDNMVYNKNPLRAAAIVYLLMQ